MAQLNYNQVANLLNQAYNQKTGRADLTALPWSTYQQVFSTAYLNNTDNLYNYLETVIAKTIFSIRPYSDRLRGMEWETQKYGDIVRKLTPMTVDNLDNSEWSIDAELAKTAANQDFACCSAPVRQDFLALRVSGGNTYSRKWTMYRNQMNAAFESQAQVSDFFSMLMTERENRHRADKMSEKQAILANVIIGLNEYGGYQHFKALTEYNTETGLSLTPTTLMQPENFRQFMIWFASKIGYLRDMIRDMNVLYHQNVTGKVVDRHTPDNKQRLYLHSQFARYFENNKADLHSPGFLDGLGDFESIPYWQSPKDIYSVNGTAKILDAAGTTSVTDSTEVKNVIGLLTDVDMFGLCNIDIWTAPEPYNARYGFQNTWYHDTYKSLIDFTENGILITLD